MEQGRYEEGAVLRLLDLRGLYWLAEGHLISNLFIDKFLGRLLFTLNLDPRQALLHIRSLSI